MHVSAEVLGWLRESANTADSWDAVAAALVKHDPARGQPERAPDPRLRPFVLAYNFVFHEASSAVRQSVGAVYGPLMAGPGWQFPPPLDKIEEADVAAWQEAVAALDHPVVHARLGDLIWERKARPSPHTAARSAIDALLVLASDPSWRGMDRVRCLSRAFELARQLHDMDRQAQAVGQMLAQAEVNLASENGGPGIVLGLLEPLLNLPADERHARLDELLAMTADRYGADPFIHDSVADARSRIAANDEARLQLRREQVRRWRNAATQVEGMLRVYRLEQALEIARNYGLPHEADELRGELSKISPDELGLKTVTAEFDIPSAEIDAYLERFRTVPDWETALRLLAAAPAPGGSPDDLEQHVAGLMEAHPIAFMFPKALVGPDNATAIYRAVTPEQHRRLATAEERTNQSRFFGTLFAYALHRIADREDRPDSAALTGFLTSSVVEPEVAERIGRAIELFWNEQYDESAHLIVPRLERVIREMARQAGVPIVREPRPGREVGGVETLGALLQDLKNAFVDKATHAYLVNLLVDPLGLNLRNRTAHGLHGPVGAVDSALLIQAALLVASLSLTPLNDPPTPPPGASLG